MGRIVGFFVGLAVFAAMAWGAAWFGGQALIGQVLQDAITVQARQGVTIRVQDPTITGAPGTWQLGPTSVDITVSDPSAPMDLSAQAVTVAADLLNPLVVASDARGVVVELPPALPIIARPYLSIDTVAAAVGLTIDGFGGGMPRFVDVTARDVLLGEDTLRILTAEAARLQLRQRTPVAPAEPVPDDPPGAGDPVAAESAAGSGADSVLVAADVQALTLPTGLALPLGPVVQEVAAITDWPEPWPTGSTVPALARWQAAGGTVVVEEARLIWDDFRVIVSGTLQLDADLQPAGVLEARIVGLDPILDWAVATGQVSASNMRAVRFGLQLISRMGEDGRRVIIAPVVIEDRQVRLGPLPIAQLPRIAWASVAGR